jgi:hypothetical protein
MSKVTKETHVDGLGTIFYCNDSAFDDASEAVLNTKADGLITLKELAYARIQEGKDSSVSTNGSYVKEGSLFVPKVSNKRIWLRESLVLQNPADAVKAHKKGNEYLLPEDFDVDKHLEQIGKDNYFVVSDTTPVPTNRFDEDSRMQWAFGDVAQQYGQFLADAGIKNVNIYMHTNNDNHIDSRARPFANQLWLHRLGDYFYFLGLYRSLYDNGGVRGVRRDSNAVGVAQKNSDLYNTKQIFDALDKAGLSIKGNLEKTVLDNLRNQ